MWKDAKMLVIIAEANAEMNMMPLVCEPISQEKDVILYQLHGAGISTARFVVC